MGHNEIIVKPLPDPFTRSDKTRVTAKTEWESRRKEILSRIIETEYGGLPPAPSATVVEPLHPNKPKWFPGTRYTQYRLVHGDDRSFHFRLDVHLPERDVPVPVILCGDGCWLYITDILRKEILDRGYALAVFSRTEIVPDMYTNSRDTGLYRVYPEEGFGAIAAWAWGYHRAVDALEQIEEIDASRIAVVGHSRGAKTSLLAGASDPRIALTGCNAGGCGGTGSFLFQGKDCELLSDILGKVPYWFGRGIDQYKENEAALPFDQHFLISSAAPRPFFTSQAYGDLWANPKGSWQSITAAREVYRFLGAGEKIGHFYRSGTHAHTHEDWTAFLDFADRHLQERSPDRSFTESPFPETEPAFTWTAPEKQG
ncbi:MAG: dienelactone hydrolase family protein [Spirochaetia bacterium]